VSAQFTANEVCDKSTLQYFAFSIHCFVYINAHKIDGSLAIILQVNELAIDHDGSKIRSNRPNKTTEKQKLNTK